MKDLEAERVGRIGHLDVFIIVVVNIIGMTTQNQHINVVMIGNVYANQKNVSTVLPAHIKTKQVLLRVKLVHLGRTIPNKDKLVVLHAIQARFPQLDSLIAQHVHQMHILLIEKNA